MPRLLALDVDGTVVDTFELNRRAYAEVGVEYPCEAWGATWEAWLPTAANCTLEEAALLHRAKSEIYADLIERTDLRELLLPPGRVAYAHLAQSRGPVRYFTAGSSRTATLLLARLGILSQLEAGLTYARRELLLAQLPRDAVYVDDRLDTIVRLRQGPALGVNLIHYSGQTYERLLEEMLLWNRWTR